MKPTDFSMHLTSFLSDYLPIQKNVSRNTIKSYRDTFKLLLLFCEKEESLPVEKITMVVAQRIKVPISRTKTSN